MADKFTGDIKAGSIDVSLAVLLRSTTDNTEVTGKIHSDVTGSYWRQGGTRTAITMATLAAVNSAHADGGFKEVDAINQPGLYRFDIPDAAFASGADWVIITAKVTGAYVVHQFFDLASKTPKDNNDELIHATYGLAKLVRATTPANTLSVDAAGKVTLASATHSGAVIPSVTTVTGNVTGSVGSISGITFPANFGDMAITLTTGQVTVGTNNDKTGYSLTQTFPANFADLAITATTGRVDLGNWLGAAPNALIAGRPDVNLGASQANSIGIGAVALDAIDATALATTSVNEIRDAVWNHLESTITTAGSIGLKLKNTLPTTIIKNTALNAFPFVMFDSTDHVTPKTALTVTATRSIDGGVFAAAANAVVEIGNGAYKINLAASDLNGDTIILRFAATGADDRLISIVTQKAAA